METEDYVEDILEWVGRDDKRQKIIRDIVEYEVNTEEASFEDRADGMPWSPTTDISVPPSYIGMLKSCTFIDIVFDSNSNTIFALEDLEAGKKALDHLKEQPDKWSEEWLDDKLGESNIDEALDEVPLDEEDREEIQRITKETDALEYWSEYIAHGLKHRPEIKKAVLLMLASPEDAHGNKGRVNILAYGPPGTGKTAIKNYLVENFGAESIDGPRVSKADITYNKSTEEFGQLPKAHKGILVVEESDEMDEQPLGAALTSLGESGEIEIRDRTIPAEAEGVFLSNFNSVEAAKDQWSTEAVNRFDFKIEFDRLSDDETNQTLDWHYEHFRQPKPDENEGLLLKYLKMCRSYFPDIDESKQIKEFKQDKVNEIENIRQGLSIMNVAWIIARLNLTDVKLSHYKQAFDIITES